GGFRWFVFFFSSRRRHTRFSRDWSSDVCSSDLGFGSWPTVLFCVVAAGVAVGLVYLYARFVPVRTGMSYLGLAPFVVAGWFAFRSEEGRGGEDGSSRRVRGTLRQRTAVLRRLYW